MAFCFLKTTFFYQKGETTQYVLVRTRQTKHVSIKNSQRNKDLQQQLKRNLSTRASPSSTQSLSKFKARKWTKSLTSEAAFTKCWLKRAAMGEERKGSQAGNKYSFLKFQGNGLVNSAKGTASYFNPKQYMSDRSAQAGSAEEPKATVPAERLPRCSRLMGNETQGMKSCSSPFHQCDIHSPAHCPHGQGFIST